jgi:hypothetical protein
MRAMTIEWTLVGIARVATAAAAVRSARPI